MNIDKIVPGDSVGMIAAQSIGQPTTQIALSSFHQAGTSAGEIVYGLPRLEEILNLTIKNTNSSCSIYTKETIDHNCLIYVEVKDLVKGFYIENNFDWWWYDIAEEVGLYKKPDKHKNKCILRLEFNKEKLYKYKISLKKLYDSIILNIPEDKIRILISPEYLCIVDFISEVSKENLESVLFEIVRENIYPIKLSGIPNILDSSNNNGIIKTIGSNLLEILSLKQINKSNTISDSILDVYNTLGIEAARYILVEELSKILKGNVDYKDRHINLLVDVMTREGFLVPINYSGLLKQNHKVLERSAYERTMKELSTAALFGRVDKIEGVTESIITGKRPRLGTGLFKII